MNNTDHQIGRSDAERLVEELRDTLDMDEDETLVLRGPQFDRGDGVEPGQPPLTEAAMKSLERAEESELKDLGLRKWSDETGLWLLPHEWHPHIPEDWPMLNILDEETCRAEYPAEPDKRFGVLSFGIVPEFERGES